MFGASPAKKSMDLLEEMNNLAMKRVRPPEQAMIQPAQSMGLIGAADELIRQWESLTGRAHPPLDGRFVNGVERSSVMDLYDEIYKDRSELWPELAKV